jgi:hypothetical protein
MLWRRTLELRGAAVFPQVSVSFAISSCVRLTKAVTAEVVPPPLFSCFGERGNTRGRVEGIRPVDRDYDLFEILPNGVLLWRAVLSSRERGMKKLQELASISTNQFLLMDVPTNSVIASMNNRKVAAC